MSLTELEWPAPPRDSHGSTLQDWSRALEAIAPIAHNPHRTLPNVIEEIARTYPGKPALLAAQERLTYGELAARANRYARWALGQNLAKGETVGLMMPNRPEYMAIWLGITSVGCIVALINTNLRGASLAHCIDIATPKHVIVAAELGEQFQSASGYLLAHTTVWIHGDADLNRIDRGIEQLSGESLTVAERRSVTISDRALNIYTSGTTGLPKAANISHRRLMQWSFWFAGLMNVGPDDRMYDCLPMYHSIGGVVATGALLVKGGSVAIRDKFSVAEFWNDIRDWDCTLFQYIGELCRYLLNAPEHPAAREHRLRLCCGNGLRSDVWEQFQERFAIPRILEFYAATEGNVSLYNVEGRLGAIGRVPPFLRHRTPIALVKFDPEAQKPARDENGLCVRCAVNEAGEALGQIHDGSALSGGEFEGYTDRTESEQKILRNVFKPGDTWYRTGDLMRIDAKGFFYFVDRVGDTFRWKGENVSTSEVAEAIMNFPAVNEAAVYGVAVPGAEGSAGMAAIVVDGPLHLPALRAHLARHLPSYARPLFLRVKDKLEVTATFKHKKADLTREGFDPDATSDSVYFDDPARKAFVPLDAVLYARIQSRKVRL